MGNEMAFLRVGLISLVTGVCLVLVGAYFVAAQGRSEHIA